MLNRQQREFRKSMKHISQEKQSQGYEDPYSYRFESSYRPRRYRRRLFFGGGFTAVLLILWNLYATSTWARAWVDSWTQHVHRGVPTVSGSVSSGLATEQQAVNNYIQVSDEIGRELITLTKPYLNANVLNAISTQSFAQTASQFSILRTEADTTLPALSQLRQYNVRQIHLMQLVLNHAKRYRMDHDSADWTAVTQRLNEFNDNLQMKQALVISVLNTEHMPYQIHSNGEISYQYDTTANP